MKAISGKLLAASARLSVAALVCSFASAAYAGVKYWDNPDFKAYDVGDYVQDGLVLHYDGIRNVGADAEHSTTSDTWVNLASDGSLPLTWCSWISSNSKFQRVRNDTTQGTWEEDGFHFDGRSVFATEESSNLFSLPETYTMQFTMTADLSEATGTDGSGYLFRPGKDWSQGGVAVRNTANGSVTPENAVYVVDNARFNTNNTRPNFADDTPRYATVLGTSASLACFDGTSIPAVGTAYTDSCRANVNARAAHANNWIAFGAQYYNSNQTGTTRDTIKDIQGFNGTLHAIRYYSKALSANDLAWNRVVDQNRFFGESAPIPVTNIVVATAVEGVDGDQPCGAYALDAEGFTFTAPAQRTIKGKRYVLNGYTIETWNGSDWGAAVEYAVNSYDATSAGKVRLTWRYERPAGEGQLATYGLGDYVTDGLLLHYDGICNVGANAAHDSAAHQWKNIAPGYESRWPMDWCSYTESSANNYAWHRNDYTQGAWTDDGFAFNGKGYFAKWNDGDPFAIPANFTVQISVTGAIADQLGDPDYLWTGQHGWSYGSVAMRKSNNSAANGNANSVYYVNSTVHPDARPNFYPVGARPSYVTVIADYDDTKTTYIFDGTARPAAGGTDAPAITGLSPATNQTWFSVGGFHGRTGTAANLQSFNGTVHNFRFYNRALTDAEVAQNRKVDEYRYFGRYAEPNVIVQSTYSYLEGYDKCGGYEVVDSYTFAAPETVTAKDIKYECVGYTVETQDANGNWGAAVGYEGCSYKYTAGSGTVRLTWKWKATQGLRTASDYDFDDYSPAGLRLHYDGKLNAGVGVAHSTTASKWVNVGSGGDYYNMSLTKGDDDSAWASDGYAFGGKSKFMTAVSNVWNRTYTEQTVLDALYADNTAGNGENYVYSSAWSKMALVVCGTSNPKTVWFHTQGLESHAQMPHVANADAERFTYVTTMLDDAERTATVFTGTEPPTGGTIADGYLERSSMADAHVGKLALGGWGGGVDSYLVGTVKDFRFYDRILTQEELVRNRNVDAVRYFGALAVTNVVVTTKYADVEGGEEVLAEAAGAYKVEGCWTFTATKVKDVNGNIKNVAGYYTEELVNGAWSNKTWHDGISYTYQEGDDAATVRLTWSGPPPGMMIIVR